MANTSNPFAVTEPFSVATAYHPAHASALVIAQESASHSSCFQSPMTLARARAKAGAIKYLWDRGYRPDIVCGVSVRALNALKVAEGRDSTADELVETWRDLSADDGFVFEREHHLQVFARLMDFPAGTENDFNTASTRGPLRHA